MGNSGLSYSIVSRDDTYIELEHLHSTPLPPPPTPLPPALIKQQLLTGDLALATASLTQGYPELLQPGSAVYLSLHSQAFIELLRLNQTSQALLYAQLHLAGYRDRHFKTAKAELRIRDLMGLICFKEPRESDVGYLMEEKQRKVTAEVVIKAVSALDSSGRKCPCSFLCRCFRASRPH